MNDEERERERKNMSTILAFDPILIGFDEIFKLTAKINIFMPDSSFELSPSLHTVCMCMSGKGTETDRNNARIVRWKTMIGVTSQCCGN